MSEAKISEAAVYGIRVKGNPVIVGVLPVPLKDFPVKNPEWDERYEEVPLYLHPQPAELAEQQGVELPPLPASSAHDPHTGEPLFSESKMRMFANAALAATGKQQVGEVQGDGLLMPCRFCGGERGHWTGCPAPDVPDQQWVTDAMVDAALSRWFNTEETSHFADIPEYKTDMRNALTAAIEHLPTVADPAKDHPGRQYRMLQKLGSRLAELLDEDQWAECEEMLVAIDSGPWLSVARAKPARYLTQRELDSIGSQAEGMDGEQWDRWVQAKFAEVNGLATVDWDARDAAPGVE